MKTERLKTTSNPRHWFEMKSAGKSAEINIYGPIGKYWADDDAMGASEFSKALAALGDVSDITLRINSPGGDVYDGIAIHNLVKGHPARVTARIDGLAASAASYVAMAADEIVMPSNAFMLIHEPSGVAIGTSDTMMAVASDLKRMTGIFAATYAKRSGMSQKDIRALMKEDRLLTADEAKEKGMVDTLDEPVKMAASYSLDQLPTGVRNVLMTQMEIDIDEETAVTEINDPLDDNKNTPAENTVAPAPAVDVAPANVVNLDTVRGLAFDEAQEIAELCTLSGLADRAAGYIAARTPIADVRKDLLKCRAAESERTAITGTHAALVAQATDPWEDIVAKLNTEHSKANRNRG